MTTPSNSLDALVKQLTAKTTKPLPLTKFLYGAYTDSTKSPFGLLNGQYRVDSIINSAGWYNSAGEKLGNGDLNITDLQRIAKSIPQNEMFIVLSEFDSSWGVPSSMDQSAPGKDYVMKRAVWVIGRDAKIGSVIMRVRDDIDKLEEKTKDGIKYHRFPRSEMYAATGYIPRPKKPVDPNAPKKAKAKVEDKQMVSNPLLKGAAPIPAIYPPPRAVMPPPLAPPYIPFNSNAKKPGRPKKTGPVKKP